MTLKPYTNIAVILCKSTLDTKTPTAQNSNPPISRPQQDSNQKSATAPLLRSGTERESSSLQNTNCSPACQTQIIKKLSDNSQNLTDDDIRRIAENAEAFAAILVKNPNDLAALLNSLENEDNARIHPAALAITGAMSQEDHIEVSTILLNHADTNARIVGLRLINNLDVQNETSISLFNNLISTEADSEVLVTAINTIIADPKNGDSFAPALDTIISRQESDFVWGTALLTKVRLSPTNTKSNVEQALANPSAKMRRYGMQALHLLKRIKFLKHSLKGLRSRATVKLSDLLPAII